MQIKDTYYIKRNGNYIWLSHNVKPEETDEVIEVKKVLIADDGKDLVKGEEVIGGMILLDNEKDAKKYSEVDQKPREEEEENDA